MGLKKNQVKGKSALRFYHEVLHLDELHYGLWADEPLNLDGLRIAQRRYSQRLVSLIPKSHKRILDVGAGTGTISSLLNESGFDVEGLSPDPYQEKVYIKRTGLPFHLNWFEKFRTTEHYDLILMAESAQYISLNEIFRVASTIAPGGYLLIADFFVRKQEDCELGRRGHPLAAFQEEAERCGFVQDHFEDVTDATLPTMDLARLFVEQHIKPALNFVGDAYGGKHPVLFRCITWLLRHKIVEWQQSLQHLDSEEFARLKRYLIIRYRIPG